MDFGAEFVGFTAEFLTTVVDTVGFSGFTCFAQGFIYNFGNFPYFFRDLLHFATGLFGEFSLECDTYYKLLLDLFADCFDLSELFI